MTKISYTATDANGAIHTRTTSSGRIYTHTVVHQPTKAAAIARAHQMHPGTLKNCQYQFDSAAQGMEAYADAGLKRFPSLGRDYFNHQWAEHAEFAAKWGTAAAYAQHVLDKHLASIEATDFTVWHNAGWCGRLDLARKLASNYPVARILEAVVVPPKVKA